MATTNLDQVAGTANIKLVTSLPQTPQVYYGTVTGDVANTEWQGGEQVILNYAGVRSVYYQLATSGTTPTWRKAADLATSTTSSSTSTSTSTSSSTSTSTSSSSTTTSA